MQKVKLFGLGLMLVCCIFLSCDKEETFIDLPVYGPEQIFYAISGNNLLTYNAKSVKTNTASVALTGLSTGERLLSIDFSPYTGQLYGLSSLSKIYTISTTSGVAVAVNDSPFSPALNTTNASIDFDPASNIINVITALGQSLSINPESGVATENANTQTELYALASNQTAGATDNVFFAINSISNKLYKKTSATSAWQEIGDLNTTFGPTNNSLDISPDNANALAVSKTAEGARLFTIDMATGKATLSGKFPNGLDIQCIAIPTNPIAYTISGNNLAYFNPSSSSDGAVVTKTITGLQTGESVVAIDMRPKNGQLFAVGSTSRLYTVNPATGVFKAIGNPFYTPLSGTAFDVDFNPVQDLLTLISNTGQYLDISLNGTAVAQQSFPAEYKFTAIAYSNNFANAGSATLYAIDGTAKKLYTIVNGTPTEVGPLGDDTGNISGFDIYSSGSSNTASILGQNGSSYVIYSLSLNAGSATKQSETTAVLSSYCLGLRF